MRKEVAAEFGKYRARAIVLDDHASSRRMTARKLESRGFLVVECKNVEEFLSSWAPGMADLIIADWQLSASEHGDQVLVDVRLKDWDVPFVLVSGKLDMDERRVRVLEVLLGQGGAKFVARGDGGIEKACEEGEALIERRDMTLVRVILALREGANDGAVIQSSGGPIKVKEQLAKLLAAPSEMHKALSALSSLEGRGIVNQGKG